VSANQKRIRELELELELAEAEEAEAAAPAVPVPPARHGASGSWGMPDLGPLNAIRTQFHAGLLKGGSDESTAAAFALGDRHGPGAYLRLPDGREVPVPTREDMYRASRDFIRQEQEAADQHWPKLGFLANMGGEIASDAALAGPRAVTRGYQTVAGLARGLMGSDAELTPDRATLGDVGSAALSTTFGGVVGNVAPLAINRIARTGVAKYVGGKLEDAAVYAGDKLKNLAGWFKVNSLHPNPLVGEAMASLPGGTPAVGRELLDRGIGGLTKKGTAKQTATAASEAGAAIDDLVRAHDAAGAGSVDIGSAINVARAKATELMDEPTTKAVGQRLMDLVNDYQAKFGKGTASAADALKMKRALADVAYGQSEILKRTGDTVAGKFGEGVSVFERSVDEAMDRSLGPGFEAANLTFRRLKGAANAAERSAARSQGNQLISLKTLLALGAMGGAGAAGGVPGAVAMGLGTKYGSQLGARTLYGLGSALEAAPAYVGRLSQGFARGAAPYSAASRLRDLLLPGPELPALPAWAGDPEETQRRALVGALGGGP